MAKRRNGYPMVLERGYQRSIYKLVRKWQRIAQHILKTELKPYVYGGTKLLGDADSQQPDWSNAVQLALNLLSIRIKNATTDQDLQNIATSFVYSVDAFSAAKTAHHKGKIKLKAKPTAINPLQGSPQLQNYVKTKIAQNAALIKTMNARYAEQLQDDIYRAVNGGGGMSDISHAISKRTGMSLRHADLIATDQTGTILSQIDAYRNQESGSKHYIWRSMEDDRVRPEHQELDGQEFAYDDPDGGDEGQLPGEPIRCRCYAEPVD